jgi:hypothetical protein
MAPDVLRVLRCTIDVGLWRISLGLDEIPICLHFGIFRSSAKHVISSSPLQSVPGKSVSTQKDEKVRRRTGIYLASRKVCT